MAAKKVDRLHVVDGTYELFRAFYGRGPDRTTAEGRPFKAVAGVVGSVLALLRDEAEAVTHLAVAFDRPIESFRNELFEGYKTGEGMDPELVEQMEPAEEALAALGVTVWPMDEWEADDALATAAARFAGEVGEVRLMTPDKDLGQCLVEGRVVQVDRMREKVIDVAALRERRGIAPASLPDWLALVGDSADGIPGLPGFGEKTVSRLLARFETLEAIPDDPAAWPEGLRGAPRLAGVLARQREEALLYRRLATLATDVPLRETLDDLRWRGAPRQRWEAYCESVGMPRWKTRPPRFDDED
ncbi:MAG: 5'-3' exonuclease H3TH domain-containing protein [Deltaproteobacteria bacterium]|nr:5'-3' exonuclease H3TH domain-containing protein [Deltaproteobacteria bacterium]